ncbi:hypothetical protein CTI12_AA054250 [Artemisia annua]|uniref:Bromodomain, NET domain protein n=1 Tax=Artemisia annua TaxID=35608 RepID=A0A2U1QAM3_ARTAN|nr:hypothetical protein CTI12_AA054250 [Artemisia annua]
MDSEVLIDADKINKDKSTCVNLVYTRRPKKPKTTPVEAVVSPVTEPVIEPANGNHETLISDNNGPSSSGQSQHHENGVVLFKQQQQEPLVSLLDDRVKICLNASTPKPEINDLKGRLEQELEQVRVLYQKLEKKENEIEMAQVLIDADKINKDKSTCVNLVYTRRPKKPKTTPVEAVVSPVTEPVIEPANGNHETLISDNNGPSSSGQSQHHENGVVLFKQQQQEPLVSLLDDRVKICLNASTPKPEINDLKGRLEQELEQVRVLYQKLEKKENEIEMAPSQQPQQSPTLLHYHTPPVTTFDRRSFSRVSSDTGRFRHLTVSVTDNDYFEKEKRTPKANHLYPNSDFLLAKDRLPPESNKRPKPSTGLERHKNQVFRSCSNLLQRLMKHKHGWVFNEPVNAKLLGLHDYHDFIKRPMDLGTIKSRLAQNFYKVPSEFAEDVRLTFTNAMTYNPRGHEVYVMAEQLSNIFEEKWGVIESDWNYGPSVILPKPMTYTPMVRTPVPKKPKARDPNKRDMTFEEKQKLSANLQSLPSEKLDSIVQIIKKSNTLSQNDEEIEVDIDSVDVETLWELDRFVMNYRKNLSKVKRRAEIQQERALAGNNLVQNPGAGVTVPDAPKENRADEQGPAATAVNQGESRGDNASRSSSSSSSSSDSSSSDSDSDSSSDDGSDHRV